ncbi:MAG TPA: XRE family transcriptional regulator [Aliiroseovarius sp.]|nr:XRE family transcriptional regulator [Aliiroseovarius sp.]
MNAITHSPRSEDVQIGQRLKQRRILQDMTQAEIASAMGISFQQVQKYETGANRISASRICDLSRILRVEPGYFFEGVCGTTDNSRAETFTENAMLRALRRLPPHNQRAVLNIARAIVNAQEQNPSCQHDEMRAKFEEECG